MARRDPFVERVDEAVDVELRDTAFHLHARHQPQRHGGDDAEQPVSADHVAEQFGTLRAAAADQVARGRDHLEAFDVGDEGLSGQSAAMDVGGDGAAERQPVRAGLLLADAERRAGGRAAAKDSRE